MIIVEQETADDFVVKEVELETMKEISRAIVRMDPYRFVVKVRGNDAIYDDIYLPFSLTDICGAILNHLGWERIVDRAVGNKMDKLGRELTDSESIRLHRWIRLKYFRIIMAAFYPYWEGWYARNNQAPGRQVMKVLVSVDSKLVWPTMLDAVMKRCEEDPYLEGDIKKYRYVRVLHKYASGQFRRGELSRAKQFPVMRRIMAEMPGRLPAQTVLDVIAFGPGRLKRVIRTRTEWLAAAMFLDPYRVRVEGLIEILNRSTAKQVEKAFRIIQEQFPYYTARRALDITQAFAYIRDAQDVFSDRITIDRAARVSLAWHDAIERQDQAARSRVVLPEDNVSFPALPYALPDDPRFEYIADVERLSREGVEMGHCVGTYAMSCRNGHSFIVAFNDEELGRATIELNYLGSVVQCRGPRNHMTKATKEAQEVYLKHWREAIRPLVFPDVTEWATQARDVPALPVGDWVF
jgi:hypothetical protein